MRKTNDPKNKLGSSKILHVDPNITLTRDYFGIILDEKGKTHYIKRFTWKNHNNVEVQVITYGARITSIRLPDRLGRVEDVVLSYEDIPGSLYYEEIPLGATLGRCTNRIENSTFVIDGRQYYVTKNDNNHHKDGGCKGFDKIIWRSHVDGTRLILSHVSGDLDQGYPGDLFVRIIYELSTRNEFRVTMEAQTSKPTIVNLSNLLYMNLAGHHGGPEELYQHIVTINANCYTKNKGDNLPSGKIMNVIYTKNDFMQPTLLKDVMGIEPEDGYDQNFCINRSIDQNMCFAGRALHIPSGRIMEIYTNQYGINFSTANDFGSGLVDVMQPYQESTLKLINSDLDQFDLVNRLYNKMQKKYQASDYYSMLKRLIRNIYKCTVNYEDLSLNEKRNVAIQLDDKPMDNGEEEEVEEEEPINVLIERLRKIKLTKDQREYLELMQSLSATSIREYVQVKEIIGKILDVAPLIRTESSLLRFKMKEEQEKNEEEEVAEESLKSEVSGPKYLKRKEKDKFKEYGITAANKIPTYYKDGRIHGKDNCIYKRHCAFALQTQNYPNAIYHKNFPNCVLRPGETYSNTTIYKFWIQKGDPSKWIRRYKKRIRDQSDPNTIC